MHMRLIPFPVFTNLLKSALKLSFTGEMFASHRKSELLNPFPVTNLWPGVELVHLLRMLRDCLYLTFTFTFGADSRSRPALRPCMFGPMHNPNMTKVRKTS